MTSSTSSDPPSARAADPLARGIIPTAVQSIKDLTVWDIRVPLPSTVPPDSSQPVPCIWVKPPPLANPFTLLLSIPPRGYLSFFIGFTAWTADAFDFHSLSIQTVKLATYYGRSKTDITTAITLTLLLRSVGAALFGLPGDRWGRKWPLVGNMIILGLLQIATIYCTTFQQFLGVRSLFGLFMGGVYGNAVSMALEHCPLPARGLMSGVLQQGYSLGYVLAASANLSIGGSASSWKRLFWEGMKTALVGADREEDLKMVTDFLNQAEKDLTVEKIFGRDYWNEDGTWAYEVPGEDGDITFDEVVAAHPLVIHWEGKVSNLMKEWGINWAIPGREGDQDRVGEEERRTVKNVMPAATTKNALDW